MSGITSSDAKVSLGGKMSFSSVSWDISAGNGHDREEGFRLRDMTQERFRSLYGESPLLAVHQIGATIGVHAGPTSIGYGVVRHSSAV